LSGNHYSRRQVTGGAAALWTTALLPSAAAAATLPLTWPLLGKETPHFKAPLVGGGVFDSKNHADRFLFIDIWGQWCNPCIRNAPYVKKLHASLKSEPKIQFFAMHCGPERPSKQNAGTWKDVAHFAEINGIAYDIGLDPKMVIAKGFQIRAFPSYVLIAPDRRGLLWRISAAEDKWEALRDEVLAAVVTYGWSNYGSTSFRKP
jgi:thiol-disulfide isomerase/thioredoxin